MTLASTKMVRALPSVWLVRQGSYQAWRMQRHARRVRRGITAAWGQVSAWHARQGRRRQARDKGAATSVREHRRSTRTEKGAQHARLVLLVLSDLVRAAEHRPKATAPTVHQGGSVTRWVVLTVPTAIFSRRRMLSTVRSVVAVCLANEPLVGNRLEGYVRPACPVLMRTRSPMPVYRVPKLTSSQTSTPSSVSHARVANFRNIEARLFVRR